MFSSYRKLILIIIFALISLLLGFLIFYFFFYAPPIVPRTSPETTIPEGRIPIIKESDITGIGGISPEPSGLAEKSSLPQASDVAKGGITKSMPLYTNPVYGAALAPNGQDIISYDRVKGQFVRITPDGKLNLMSDKIFHNVEKVTWSPDKNSAILEYPDGANITYNFRTNRKVTLPKHWEGFTISPAGQIAAKSITDYPENNWLIISDMNGENIKTVEHLGENGDKVYNSWSPNNQVIAMYAESKDFDRQKLFFFGPNNERLPLTIIEGRGFESQWSKNGDKLLYSVYNSASDFKPILWTVLTEGKNFSQYRKKINVNTWAGKCSFSSNEYIYCAVPESLPEGAGIYPDVADKIPDNIYKININTGDKKLIARPDDNATIDGILISEDEKYLYYMDTGAGILNKILLK